MPTAKLSDIKNSQGSAYTWAILRTDAYGATPGEATPAKPGETTPGTCVYPPPVDQPAACEFALEQSHPNVRRDPESALSELGHGQQGDSVRYRDDGVRGCVAV
ncbi:MAG: hypothetical protein ABI083_06070, partial [Lapillicoccus sp.]